MTLLYRGGERRLTILTRRSGEQTHSKSSVGSLAAQETSLHNRRGRQASAGRLRKFRSPQNDQIVSYRVERGAKSS